MNGEYILDCDASDVGISGVISQIRNGEERVISDDSRTLSKAEKNYFCDRQRTISSPLFRDIQSKIRSTGSCVDFQFLRAQGTSMSMVRDLISVEINCRLS